MEYSVATTLLRLSKYVKVSFTTVASISYFTSVSKLPRLVLLFERTQHVFFQNCYSPDDYGVLPRFAKDRVGFQSKPSDSPPCVADNCELNASK